MRVLVTSLPADIPAGGIFAAYRLRWQIELAIKWLKSVLGSDELPTRTRNGSLHRLHADINGLKWWVAGTRPAKTGLDWPLVDLRP